MIESLSLVSVTAQAGDDVYRIFESLNNTGMRLSQGNLLRNYLFMRLPNRTEAVYQSLWLPMRKLLNTAELEQLFWLDLARENPRAKQTEIYADHQRRLERIHREADVEADARGRPGGGPTARAAEPVGREHGPTARAAPARPARPRNSHLSPDRGGAALHRGVSRPSSAFRPSDRQPEPDPAGRGHRDAQGRRGRRGGPPVPFERPQALRD